MAGKFEIYRDKGGEYRFRLKVSNGQIILASEGYKVKASSVKRIESVKRNAQTDARFVRKPSKEQFMLNLTATNGQVMGTSERYKSEHPCENGVQSVMKHAPEATVEDLTAAA